MNTTYSMRVENDLKKQFLEKSKSEWFEGSALLRYFMKSYVERDGVVNIDIEEKIFDEMFQSPEFIAGFTEMSQAMRKAWL